MNKIYTFVVFLIAFLILVGLGAFILALAKWSVLMLLMPFDVPSFSEFVFGGFHEAF